MNFKSNPMIIRFQANGTEKDMSEIQVMKTGVFSYWYPDDMPIDSIMFDRMIANFKSNLLQVDLAIDYGHNAYEKAAGWIEDLYTNEEGTELWAKVKWVPAGLKALSEKEWRYISAEFSMNYTDDQGEAYGPVLYGAGLTNRPFLTNMQPVTDLDAREREKKLMNVEEKLKLSEEKAAKLNDQTIALSNEVKELKATIEEKDAEIKKFAQEKIDRDASDAIAQKKARFDKMFAEGKVCEAQREAFMADDVEKFASLSAKLNVDGKGTSEEVTPDTDLSSDAAQAKIIELATKRSTEKNIQYSKAVKEILSENPILKAKYEGVSND